MPVALIGMIIMIIYSVVMLQLGPGPILNHLVQEEQALECMEQKQKEQGK